MGIAKQSTFAISSLMSVCCKIGSVLKRRLGFTNSHGTLSKHGALRQSWNMLWPQPYSSQRLSNHSVFSLVCLWDILTCRMLALISEACYNLGRPENHWHKIYGYKFLKKDSWWKFYTTLVLEADQPKLSTWTLVY